MAFSYGKDTLKIKNPFKKEGLLDIILGIATLILGIILVFKIRNSIDSGFQGLAWLELLLAFVFISIGISSIIKGCLRVFRFLVGREIPSNLSPRPYSQETMESILMKRINPTYIEKDAFISRLIISIYDKFLFLPIGFRNLLDSVASLFLSGVIFYAIYLLTIFSTSIGLIVTTNQEALAHIFGLVFLAKQLIVWIYYLPVQKRISGYNPNVYKKNNVVINIIAAILIPGIVEILFRKGMTIPAIESSLIFPIFLLFLFSAALVVLTAYLCLQRITKISPETAVSEYKEHIQISVHPKDVFRCFEIEMAKKRYKELPNRVYKEIKPVLELEGSLNKGSFHGSTVQETQPKHQENSLSKNSKKIKFYTAIIGRALLFLSFVYLFFSIESLKEGVTLSTFINIFYYPILTILFSYYLIYIAHIFYSEVLFTSYLVHFFSDGTYTESKVSSGMSVYDSTRTENTVVNTSATPWILVSKIVTSTLTNSSTKNLEGPRYLLEMNKADDFLTDLVTGFNDYLKNRNLLVDISSEKDIQNTVKLNKLNSIDKPQINNKEAENITRLRDEESNRNDNLNL